MLTRQYVATCHLTTGSKNHQEVHTCGHFWCAMASMTTAHNHILANIHTDTNTITEAIGSYKHNLVLREEGATHHPQHRTAATKREKERHKEHVGPTSIRLYIHNIEHLLKCLTKHTPMRVLDLWTCFHVAEITRNERLVLPLQPHQQQPQQTDLYIKFNQFHLKKLNIS